MQALRIQFALPLAAITLMLAGCDIPGLGPDPRIAQREADGRAIGGACRHALRGIEDCYGMNEKAPKTAVFEGWKEMDQYMRENKIEGVPPKEAKAPQAEEVIIDDKKPAAKGTSKEKASADTGTRPDIALASSRKPADKPEKAEAH